MNVVRPATHTVSQIRLLKENSNANCKSLPIQEIMSRTGSFPVQVAYDLLNQFATSNAIVLDPFCGKGTTLLAARMLGLQSYGIDVAPEAVFCSLSKIVNVTRTGVTAYLDTLEPAAANPTHIPRNVRVFFHPDTLRQLLAIRTALQRDIKSKDTAVRENAIFVLATMLGILHGHASYSLSISSSHAFAMSPGYVRRYAKEHGLLRPIRDVKECLRAKLTHLLSQEFPAHVVSNARVGSALKCSKIYPKLLGSVDIILTSPPYLNAQTYAKDNWLRQWFLGFNYKSLLPTYIQSGSPCRYREIMTKAIREIASMLKSGGTFICIAGDVRISRTGEIFRTGKELSDICKSCNGGLSINFSTIQRVDARNRYLHSLNATTGHRKNDLIERIFVAKKE